MSIPEYYAWRDMIRRCTQENHKSFKNYGARGICVCGQWLASFSNFLSDMGKKPSGHSLDRINNDGNYEPSNCRWATASQQVRNQRRVINALGVTFAKSRWQAQIQHSGRNIYLGLFKSKPEAIAVYQQARTTLWGA